MRWSDLISSALGSLRQRLFRTSLTVLGVFIGTASVVIMMSLGIGMTKSMTESMENDAAMTQLIVTGSGDDFANSEFGIGSSAKSKDKKMNAATMNELSAIDGVKSVAPIYQVDADAIVNGKKGYITLRGMTQESLQKAGVDMAEGRLPGPADPLGLALGGMVDYNFSEVGFGSSNVEKIDWLNSQIFLSFNQENSGPTIQDSTGAQQATIASSGQHRFLAKATGVIETSNNWQIDQSALVDINQLITTLRKAMPGRALPGQPATQDGKPRGNDFIYSELVVTAVDAKTAEKLTTQLREDGYQVQSNIELMKQMQSIGRVVQAVFGGIGAVSLLVAAIGIANTMLMSVYERTRQIGIMKVLGASLKDIRNLFLVESAIIGFFGGIIGLLFSLLVSWMLNTTLGEAAGPEPTKISIIPLWLTISSILFSTGIGTLAGLIPAQRAMKLSPLAAIRSE